MKTILLDPDSADYDLCMDIKNRLAELAGLVATAALATWLILSVVS